MDLDEKVKFLQSALVGMAWHTYPHIASVVGVDEDGSSIRHIGSALRARIAGKRCIVTTAHVIDHARNLYSRFAVTAIRGGTPYELDRPPDHVDVERDLASYILPADYSDEGIAFWSSKRADIKGDRLATDYLFVHGFPAVQSVLSALAGSLMNRSFPYGVMLREDDLPADLTPSQFAMDFDPDSLRGQDGQPVDWLDPHGLSGSPVWRIGASGRREDEWSPELCLIVGIVTHWRPDEKLLVATRWRHALDMIGAG